MTWFKDFYQKIEQRQEQLNRGIPTLIPFKSFPRLSKYVPGIVPGEQVIVTGSTGIGKSRFMRKLFVKDTIDYCMSHGFKIKIFLNSLEESREKVISTFINSKIFERTGKSYSFYTLNNFAMSPMSKEIRAKILECERDIDNMQKYLEVIHEANPYGLYKAVLKYLFDNGTFFLGETPELDFKNVCTNSMTWNRYVPDDPNQIVIAISDTVDAYQEEGGKNLYDTVKTYSKFYSRKQLGLICNVISVLVQQQSPEKERLELNVRGQTLIEKMKPSLDALTTCRATQSDATLVLGLFDPLKYGAYSYMDYPDLRKLKDGQFRSLILLKTREGEKVTDNEVPLCAYLGYDEFVEMPLINSKEELRHFYK